MVKRLILTCLGEISNLSNEESPAVFKLLIHTRTKVWYNEAILLRFAEEYGATSQKAERLRRYP